jgi:hypothetical protein
MRAMLELRLKRLVPAVAALSFAIASSASARAQDATPATPAGTTPPTPPPSNDQKDPNRPPPVTDPATTPVAHRPVDEGQTHDPRIEEHEARRAVYISGDLGFTRPDLGLVSDDLGFDKTAANGVLYGLGAGLRMKDTRFGLRWRVHDTTEFTLWAFALSAGYGLPLRPISPILSAHVGYVFDQKLNAPLFRSSLPQGNILPPDIDVRGVVAGLDLNASYWVTAFLRVGLFLGADLLFLHRAQSAPAQSIFGPTPELDRNPLYADSGFGVGLTLNAGVRGAFDIGIK